MIIIIKIKSFLFFEEKKGIDNKFIYQSINLLITFHEYIKIRLLQIINVES